MQEHCLLREAKMEVSTSICSRRVDESNSVPMYVYGARVWNDCSRHNSAGRLRKDRYPRS